jgi:glycosyltransferase involved in cell wall biosynthesis
MIYQLYFLSLYGKMQLKIRLLWLRFLLVKLFYQEVSLRFLSMKNLFAQKRTSRFFRVLYNQVRRQLHTQLLECHTPTHFYWRHYDEYIKRPSFRPQWLARLGLKTLVRPLKKRDFNAAQQVDVFIANSTGIQADIEEFYQRKSTVIFPPIDVSSFSPLAYQKPTVMLLTILILSVSRI